MKSNVTSNSGMHPVDRVFGSLRLEKPVDTLLDEMRVWEASCRKNGSRSTLLLEGNRMTTLSTTEAHERFSELLRRVASDKERIVLTRAGEELVAVVPIEDLALVESLEDRADIEEAREALREAREKGTTSLADLKAELGL